MNSNGIVLVLAGVAVVMLAIALVRSHAEEPGWWGGLALGIAFLLTRL